MELRTLARMTPSTSPTPYLILSAGMLRDAVQFRVSRALHSFCPCGTGEDMDVLA
jgi:hypothetical protein